MRFPDDDMQQRGSAVLWTIAAILTVTLAGNSQAQTSTPLPWDGIWTAQGTLFSIAVVVEDGIFKVSEVESLGFEWSAEEGAVKGQEAKIRVSYAGATAVIVAQLVDDHTAIAWAASCMPEFMVVCALARDRQATFIRNDSPR